MYGQNARQDGHVAACVPQALHQIEIFAHVKEKLGDGEIRTGKNLFRQMPPIRAETQGLGMRRGIGGYAHAHVGLGGANMPHKVNRMAEGAAAPVPVFGGCGGRIAAQRKHVVHTGGAQVAEEGVDAVRAARPRR